ncbi:MAG: DnaD domain protein [Anaerovoracaceae bacterium]|nr:DnaD domain protein [Bacillota bacterium]MDY2670711.1 DnaD domain protein [Anaerovoracaceae bacterium]
MNFRREKINNFYLRDTQVENIFIQDYMPDADGSFIKVYLTALMYADNEDISNRQIARHLHMAEEDVLRAWNYWEERGIIKKHYFSKDDRFHYTVEFLNLKERIFAPDSVEDEQAPDIPDMLADGEDSEAVRSVLTRVQDISGRMLGGKETREIITWICEDGINADLVCFAYDYCARRRQNVKFAYVSAVLKNWVEEGISTVEEAENMLSENDQRHNQYRRVMKALGFTRNPTEDERAKIDSWFDDMNFSIEKVLEACSRTSGISNPNINYVNSILRSWNGEGKDNKNKSAASARSAGSRTSSGNAVSAVMRMYEDARRRNSETRDAHRREIYSRIPRVREIDDRIHKATVAMMKLSMSGEQNGATADSLRMEMDELQNEKTSLLGQNGYPADYMELHYDCRKCRDTGVLDDGSRCSCFADKLKEAAG